MSNAMSLIVAGSLVDDRFNIGATAIEALTKIVTLYPQPVLQYLANANVRVVPLGRDVRYDEASPELKRLGVDVDAWPAHPAGLFVVQERTVYLRSFSEMTVIHELGHACDLALGGDVYRSSTDPTLKEIFATATAFVTPYAATGKDEFVAEAFRAMLSANDAASFWPKVSPQRLKRVNPELYTWVEDAFAEMKAAVSGAAPERITNAA